MEPREMRPLVESARVARLATVGSDGRPHLVPVCFALVGDLVYSAVDHKPKRSAHLKRLDNVRATGHVSLLVDRYDEDWSSLWWVRLDGTAAVIEGRHAIRALVDKYPQYARQPPAGPVVEITVIRWSGWTARG